MAYRGVYIVETGLTFGKPLSILYFGTWGVNIQRMLTIKIYILVDSARFCYVLKMVVRNVFSTFGGLLRARDLLGDTRAIAANSE